MKRISVTGEPMRTILRRWPVIGALLLGCLVRPQHLTAAPGQIVTVGPTGLLTEQIEYLTSTWPDQFAIAVVEASEDATCGAKESMIYCDAEVRPKELILVRWVNSSPEAPGDTFRVHYWYAAKRATEVLRKGDRVIVFLAPTHTRGVYSCTVMMPATAEAVSAVRTALGRSED